jgi:Uma2 family endonuclease
MATTNLVNVEEYLHSTFEHDAEYVEGRIVYRAVPQKTHSKTQSFFDRTLHQVGHPLGYHVFVEQRLRTQHNPARYRIPDVCLTFGEPDEEIFTTPPFLCVEILSPDDVALELRMKVAEYLRFGVRFVWVVDPVSLTGDVHTVERIDRVPDGVFRADQIEVDIRKA